MSDLWLWADQQPWGGPVRKLVAMKIAAYSTQPDRIAYELTSEKIAVYAEVTVERAERVLAKLIKLGHVYRVVGAEGAGLMLGAVYRREEIVLRMGSD